MIALLSLLACADRAADFRPEITGVPAVVDLGTVETIPQETWQDSAFGGTAAEGVLYAQLGAPENAGIYGGATVSFRGTGGPVCVVADPEAVFWNLSVDADAEGGRRYSYLDNVEDDGDLDVAVGLTAYYTGSPGVEMGDFNAVYDDPSGVEHTIAFNECVQVGRFGDLNVHAGRATVEFCDVDTDQRAGIPYTIVLRTFALPHDDSILSYGVAVFEGRCEDLAPTECTLRDEVSRAEPEGATPAGKEWFPVLEDKVCDGVVKVNTFCEEEGIAAGACIDPNE